MNADIPDPDTVLTEQQLRRLTRRQLLALLPLVGAGALAIPAVRERLLAGGMSLTDQVSGALSSSRRLVRTYRDADLTPLEKFPYNSFGELEPDVDLDSWALLVEGQVERPGQYSLEAIRSLPKQVQNVRHICVEGWSVVGRFGGARLGDFLDHVGADPTARFVEVLCNDDYYTSFDMASCRHPQTLLCYEMYGAPIDRGHGAPLRIHMPTKLGYKSAKYLFSLSVSDAPPKRRGFWEDQGYSCHAGI